MYLRDARQIDCRRRVKRAQGPQRILEFGALQSTGTVMQRGLPIERSNLPYPLPVLLESDHLPCCGTHQLQHIMARQGERTGLFEPMKDALVFNTVKRKSGGGRYTPTNEADIVRGQDPWSDNQPVLSKRSECRPLRKYMRLNGDLVAIRIDTNLSLGGTIVLGRRVIEVTCDTKIISPTRIDVVESSDCSAECLDG